MPVKYPEVYTQFSANIIIAFILIVLIAFILLLYQNKRKAKEKEIEAMKISYEKVILQTQVEIQEEVLKNISMELHDNIGQVLLLANINETLVQKMEGIPTKASDIIAETKKILSIAMQDISELSRSLNSNRIIEIGLFQAIIKELNQLERKEIFKVKIQNNTSKTEFTLPSNTQLMLFRMFQEIIKNTIKHSKASIVEFIISEQEEQLVLTFLDNGVGFNYNESTSKENNGMGMRSLQSRAQYFNGDVTIKSILQKGTSISIFIPV
ncbi:MAG: ATP-binding protein [Sediminibacterium sp.]